MHEGEGERKMREFKEKILSEEQAGRGEVAKTKVEIAARSRPNWLQMCSTSTPPERHLQR